VRIGEVDKIVIDTLIQSMKDKDPDVKGLAADALGSLGKADKKVIEALILALKDKIYYVQQPAAYSLGRLGKVDKTVIEALILALKVEDSRVRLQAADSLVRLGKAGKIVIKALRLALKDEDSDVRQQAADSLVRLGKADKSVTEIFIQAMKDKYSSIWRERFDILIRLGKADKRMIDAIRLALKDQDPNVSRGAAHSLVRLGKADKNVIGVFMQAMKNEYSSARRQAADSLGILFREKSDSELIQLLKNPSSDYRTAGAYALAFNKSITKETFDEINRLKDTDERSWVRLGAWKAFELIQPRLENEKEAKSYIKEADEFFKKKEFWTAENQYKKAFDLLKEYIRVNQETAADIKYQQARCAVRQEKLIDTLEYLEESFKYNPSLRERFKKELAQKESEWQLIKDNWYLREVILREVKGERST